VTRLASAGAATTYQREWFAGIRERVAAGEPLALINADAPQEVLRAMDIPYVVNQWWASVVSAKQRADASLRVLRDMGYPDYNRQYDAVSLGSHLLPEGEAPWGGLPRPTVVIAELSGDAGRKVFDLWDELPGTRFYALERSSAVTAPSRWWELVPHQWEEAFGPERLDLLAGEITDLAAFLTELTGQTLDLDRLRDVMDLVNEQAEWNRRTRDVIATARPTPVAVGDSIPSVMIPQWHRGTTWACDAARRLYEEVSELVDRRAAVAPGERVRLMWLGRGLWYDLSLYRRFQERYGAVFVWSMYLAIAADGYARYGDDPVRTLAARFAGLTDQLYMPPWSTEWYVKEAETHGVDGVVNLVADDVPGSYFTTKALEDAGIPVLEIRASNADPRTQDPAAIEHAVSDFIERRLTPRRRTGPREGSEHTHADLRHS
jgi:hypothetical protein